MGDLRDDDGVKALADRFYAADPVLLAWAEAAGHKNLEARIASGNRLADQAAALLTLLLGGLGGALVFAAKLLEPAPTAVAWGALLLCPYLALLAALLVLLCITARKAPMAYNEPEWLVMPGATLHDVRAGEMALLTMRIRHQAAITERQANALNMVRWAAIAVPLVFLLGVSVAGR